MPKNDWNTNYAPSYKCWRCIRNSVTQAVTGTKVVLLKQTFGLYRDAGPYCRNYLGVSLFFVRTILVGSVAQLKILIAGRNTY